MKYLPSLLLATGLVVALNAQTPAPTSTPAPKPAGDPFVKNPADAAANDGDQQRNPPNILIIFEAYSMTREDAAALLEAEVHGAARYRRVQELVKAGKARLRTLTSMVTKSGQRAVTEAIDEVRYVTNFTANVPMKGLAPSSWETRNAGETLEVEPVSGPDGHLCDLNLVPQRVSLAKFYDVGGMAGDPSASQPLFNTQKITTSVTTDENVPYYLGTYTPPPAQGAPNDAGSPEVWLSFVHTSTQKVPQPAAKPAIRDDAPVTADLEYTCYSLDRADAHDLLVPLPPIEKAWEKVQALAAEKKAQLEFVTSLRTKSGQRAVVEEIHEVRYAVEFNPPSLTGAPNTGSVTLNFAGQETGPIARNQISPGTPGKIDTRNAGITAEVEPVIQADANTVDLNQVVSNVRYLGTLQVPGAGAEYQPQPLFQTSKVTTSESVASGRRTLISTFNPPGADGVNDHTDSGRTWLLFVKATVVTP
jgi:hypothetical protein